MEVARTQFEHNGGENESDDQDFQDFPRVIYESDQLFNNSGKYQILPLKQTGNQNLPGHYLKIDGSPKEMKVSATASWDDPKSTFNIYTLMYTVNNIECEVEIIESAVDPCKVIAIKNDKVVVKTCSKPPNKYRTMHEVLTSDPEIVFIKTPLTSTSVYATYQLYSTASTKYYLAFGDNGKPMKPSNVNARNDEAKLRCLDWSPQ